MYPSELQYPISDNVAYAVRESITRGPEALTFVGSVKRYAERNYYACVTVTVPGDEYTGSSGIIQRTASFPTLQPAIDFVNARFTPDATIVVGPRTVAA